MVASRGGPEAAAKRACQPVSQGRDAGRCRTVRPGEIERRAGTWTSFRRIVPLRALPRSVPVRDPTARDRLKALVTSTSQAAFAVKTPAGRCASAESRENFDQAREK